ncbi:MAG: hypothetical protein IH921_10850 [Gemmatimonadetes bacterium]|nr:hypothetical protein [Gemmatimonadota bacterium]
MNKGQLIEAVAVELDTTKAADARILFGLVQTPVELADCPQLESRDFYREVDHPVMGKIKVPAVLSRLGLLERIPLTPEGTSLAEAKRLPRALPARGHRVFTITYHSPSLEPGHPPYVRSREDLDAFLAWLDEYLGFFHEELGGQPTTPAALRERALRLRARSDPGSTTIRISIHRSASKTSRTRWSRTQWIDYKVGSMPAIESCSRTSTTPTRRSSKTARRR